MGRVAYVLDQNGKVVKTLPMPWDTTCSTFRLKQGWTVRLEDQLVTKETKVVAVYGEEQPCVAPIDEVPTLLSGKQPEQPAAPAVSNPPKEKTVDEMGPLEKINAGYKPVTIDGKVVWQK